MLLPPRWKLENAFSRKSAMASIGAILGMALAVCSGMAINLIWPTSPYLYTAIGASAVLVFAAPSSPLAQPWPVFGGSIISALIGVAILDLVGDANIACILAVGLSIAAMSLFRCLHPPGGGAALVPIIGGQQTVALGYAFPFTVVAANITALIVAGWLFHRFADNNYPCHRASEQSQFP